ncbi:hypothetical protein C8C83_3862 [Flavobacterium sp. 90]|uniref:hypothetical protein n=1 Tax=unclassified Flavobacterium TaxID=196869 RepID=UPI000EB4A570|nr:MULTISPECIES: hypothetical protein [unclassified Flavobacterium]RKR12093.1 hypothetical protein C8C82_4183 [Flavobacterium sp. 81]TCK55865.1 hypothetical protein C8C83_3862 [Flavobacterium sp. 90]
MKNKIFIAGLIFISLFMYSCSNDDEFGVPDSKNNNFKIKPENNLKNEIEQKRIDSTTINFREVNAIEGDPTNGNGPVLNAAHGDPSNPKPPRP